MTSRGGFDRQHAPGVLGNSEIPGDRRVGNPVYETVRQAGSEAWVLHDGHFGRNAYRVPLSEVEKVTSCTPAPAITSAQALIWLARAEVWIQCRAHGVAGEAALWHGAAPVLLSLETARIAEGGREPGHTPVPFARLLI